MQWTSYRMLNVNILAMLCKSSKSVQPAWLVKYSSSNVENTKPRGEGGREDCKIYPSPHFSRGFEVSSLKLQHS